MDGVDVCTPATDIAIVQSSMVRARRNSLVGDILARNAIDKFDVNVTERCCKNHPISAIGSRWQAQNEDLLELDDYECQCCSENSNMCCYRTNT